MKAIQAKTLRAKKAALPPMPIPARLRGGECAIAFTGWFGPVRATTHHG